MEQTLCEMLEYRGFDDIQFMSSYWIATGVDKKIIIFFSKHQKLCVKNIKEYTSIIESESNVDYILIIHYNNITSFAKNSLEIDIKTPFQLFNHSELSLNITKHKLVPKHEILSKTEKDEFLKKNKFKLHNLPRILISDPVIKFIYGVKGDVIKITRQSETTGKSLYYRVVV